MKDILNKTKRGNMIAPSFCISYALLLIGCFAYQELVVGFYILFSLIILLLTLILSFYCLFVKGIKKTKLLTTFFTIHKYFYPLLLVVYIVFQVGKINIPNYFFSKYEKVPLYLLSPLVLGTSVIILEKLLRFRGKKSAEMKQLISFIGYISIVVGLFVFSLYYGSINLGYIVRDNIFIANNLILTKDEKISKDLGSIFYNLTKLVVENTEENSGILITPTVDPFKKTSHVNYIRYFIYPRYPINGKLNNNIFNEVDYVLIVRGEGDVAEPDKYFWPKESIGAEKIYALQESGEVNEYIGDYVPDEFGGIGGLIKLKK